MRTMLNLCVSLAISMIAATAAAAPSDNGNSQQTDRAAVDKDFGSLSDDGVSAFNDIHLARMDIFDGYTDQAAKLIGDALESLNKAKSDNQVLMRAESALHGPSGPGARNRIAGKAGPIAWLPIDNEIVMGETYRSSPEHAAALVDANKSLERGEGGKALDRVRLAAIDVDYVLALAPLDQSIADVEQANRLMAGHDYYGANQALRSAEHNVHYDEIDDIAHVRRGRTSKNGK